MGAATHAGIVRVVQSNLPPGSPYRSNVYCSRCTRYVPRTTEVMKTLRCPNCNTRVRTRSPYTKHYPHKYIEGEE